MRRLFFFLFLATAFFFSSCQQSPKEPLPEINDRVDNFGLIDHEGNFHQLYYYDDAEAVVLYIQGNSCPIVRNGIDRLQELRDEYAEKGVVFLMLNANLQDNRENIAREAAEFGIDIPILVDENQLVAEQLNVTRTAEAIVIDTDMWEMAYRGPVDDRLGYESQRQKASNHYLADALDAVLNDGEIADPVIASKGCLVRLAGKENLADTEIDYATQIAPILTGACMQCHYEGGIAPWAMTSYEMVRGWAPMMREVLRTKRMPPWQADPQYGHFKNDLSLTDEEITTLVHWIEAGTPRGDGPDPLKEFQPPTSEWTMGEPDLIVRLSPQEIPATGVFDYRYDTIALELDRDMWATGFEVIPGDRKVLHHVLINVKYPEGVERPIETDYPWLDGIFAAYAPGGEGESFPEGASRFLPKGSSLIAQVHYTAYGKATVDETRIGLHLSKTPPDKEYLVVGPFYGKLKIPPHEKNYHVKAERVFDQEISLYGLFPHMHFRGKSFRYTARYPDGREEILLNVPNYSFNWQRNYLLAEPVLLPAGTTVICEATFDNSEQNTFNPAPEDTVIWGEQSFDEMMIGYMSFHYGKPATRTLGMK